MQQGSVRSSAGGKLGVFGSPSHKADLDTAAQSVASNEQRAEFAAGGGSRR